MGVDRFYSWDRNNQLFIFHPPLLVCLHSETSHIPSAPSIRPPFCGQYPRFTSQQCSSSFLPFKNCQERLALLRAITTADPTELRYSYPPALSSSPSKYLPAKMKLSTYTHNTGEQPNFSSVDPAMYLLSTVRWRLSMPLREREVV